MSLNLSDDNNQKVKKMSEESYEGIPRNKIDWHPIINYEKCVSCGKCVDFCHVKSFGYEDINGKKKTIVQNLKVCVVLCGVAKISVLLVQLHILLKRKLKS